MLVEQTTMSQGLNDNKSSRIREIVSSNYVAILDEAILYCRVVVGASCPTEYTHTTVSIYIQIGQYTER